MGTRRGDSRRHGSHLIETLLSTASTAVLGMMLLGPVPARATDGANGATGTAGTNVVGPGGVAGGDGGSGGNGTVGSGNGAAGGNGGVGGFGGDGISTGGAPSIGEGGNGGVGGNGAAGTVGDTASGRTYSNSVSIIGGRGGNGGLGGIGGIGSALDISFGGNGGAGGNGAAGAIGLDATSLPVTITNSGIIQGGNGGAGGAGGIGGASGAGGVGPGLGGNGGNGADGGIGISAASGSSIVNSGIIQGGNGGAAGNGGVGAFSGTNGFIGLGGVGVQGSGITIINNGGSIIGGLGGDGSTRADAITFTGGSNSLTLNSGTITGNVNVQGGTLNLFSTSPTAGSFGNNTIGGNLTLTAGSTYTVNVNAAGQNDKITVNGVATLAGSVSVQAAAGTYSRGTIYTILTATGGRNGTIFSGVTSNYAFLSPLLSYDTNDVFLTLAGTAGSGSSSGVSFVSSNQTGNQNAVGNVLNATYANASGDWATVLTAISNSSTAQGPTVLNAISGQPVADNGTANVAMSSAVMNTVGNTLAGFHGGQNGGTRVAMAPGPDQACDFTCDVEPAKYGAWIAGVGGLGSLAGNANAAGFTYSLGGTAVGADMAVTRDLRLGIGASYVGGTQWVSGFNGNATSDAFSGFLYASYEPGKLYIDGMAGYAYANNRSTRSIVIPGLAPRIAIGSTGANQFMGQVEAGYRVDLVPNLAVIPFARLQGSTTAQNGFTESGADSLDLTVAPQTTNSLRTTLGADLAVEVSHVDVDMRLGWEHENADVSRPMTASFAGAPGNAFTVFGVTPQRDSAVVGLAFKTHVADSTELYARYDGEIATGSDNNAFTAGLRMTW